MLIQSQAGEFDIDIKGFEREGADLVMIGVMGVWESRIRVTPTDALRLIRLLAGSGAVWGFVLGLPFRRFRKERLAA